MFRKAFGRQLFIVSIAALLLLSTTCLSYGKDPYKVLGVSKDSDDVAIKKAYKKLALKYHPDKNSGGQAKFIEVQQAYEILSDADKKREYDLGGGSSYGGGGYHQQRHHHYQQGHSSRQQQQQQYHYHFHYAQQQQQEQEQMYERALPSNTSFLTTSNFRSLVFYGGRPWFMMVYTESSAACREFSLTWEALWRSLGGSQPGGGARDGASVGLGRVHARFQRSLVQWIARSGGPSLGGRSLEEELPVLLGVPTGCMEPSCFVRYRGPLRLSSLQDFVADRLLRLPRVPQLQPPEVAAFLRRASPYKVVVVAFGRGGGSGSLTLRSLAAAQRDMMVVVRAHVQESSEVSAAAWQAALGLSSPPAAGTVVFLRGPGTPPRTLTIPPGQTANLQQQIDQQGLLWQEVPPLRPATGSSLGCLWGRAAASSGRPLIDTCVVAVGTHGPHMQAARRRMAQLGWQLAAAATQRNPLVSAAAGAFMSGRLRLTWLDASAQRPLCAWLLADAAALRPTDPLKGAGAGGGAASKAAAMAAAAAKGPALQRALCGPGPWDLWGQAVEAAAAAADVAGLASLAARLRPAPAVHLVVLRPSVDGSSWFKGGSSHTRNGRRVFLHAVNADFDLAAGNRTSGSDDADALLDLAIWVNQMHRDPDRQLHSSAAFPPELQPDDEPGPLEFVTERLYEGVRALLQFVTVDGGGEGSSQFGAEFKVANLALAVLLFLLVQLAVRRGFDNLSGRDGNAAAAPAAASARPAPTPASACPANATQNAEASGDDFRRRSGGHGANSDGSSGETGLRHRERTAPVNRRAQSPSWQSGRRGDAHGGDVSEDVDGRRDSGHGRTLSPAGEARSLRHNSGDGTEVGTISSPVQAGSGTSGATGSMPGSSGYRDEGGAAEESQRSGREAAEAQRRLGDGGSPGAAVGGREEGASGSGQSERDALGMPDTDRANTELEGAGVAEVGDDDGWLNVGRVAQEDI